MSFEAATAISFSLTSGSATGIDYGSTFQTGYEVATTGTVSGASVTINSQIGSFTSATANLAGQSREVITLANSRIKTTGLVFVTVQTGCTTGSIAVVSVTTSSDGSSEIIVANIGAVNEPCASTYKLGFSIFNP